MAKLNYRSNTLSIILRMKILDTASTTGAGKTGLAYNTAGLIVATIADNEATTTRYRASSSEIEDITTLGTFAAPTAGKCRFKEVDATNHPGLYEIQLEDARWSILNARSLIITVSGASGAAQVDAEVQFEGVPANVTQWSGNDVALTSTNGVPKVDVSLWRGSAPSNLTSGLVRAQADAIAIDAVDAAAIADGAITAAKIATDAIDADALKADAVTEIQSGLATAADLTTVKLDTDGLDAILIESGIIAGADLTNDSGTQLTSINARQALALAISALNGILAGAATTNITMKPAGLPAASARIDATVDADGNRSAITLVVPD